MASADLTKERVKAAENLKLSITAGVGSDHVDLHAAADAGMTVAEVTGGQRPRLLGCSVRNTCGIEAAA